MISIVPTGNLGGLNPSIVSVTPVAASRIVAGDLVMFDLFDTSSITEASKLVDFDDNRCPFNVVVTSPVDAPSASVWGVAMGSAEIGQRVKVAVTGLVSAKVYASGSSLVAGASVGPDAVGGRMTQASSTVPSLGIFMGIVETPFSSGAVSSNQSATGYVLFDGFAAIASGSTSGGGGGLSGAVASGTANQLNYVFNSPSNVIEFAGSDPDCYGNVISGGGNSVQKNIIYGDTSLRTISGGYNNVIGVQGTTGSTTTIASTIGGGAHHRIALNADNGENSVTPSGTTSPDHGTICGGSYGLIANGSYGTICGGTINTIYETDATSATATGAYAFIGGGVFNIVSGSSGVVAGGNTNRVLAQNGFIGGGVNNTIDGTKEGANIKSGSVVAGGSQNTIRCAVQASIVGGSGNSIGSSTTVDYGLYGSIIGGINNYIGNGVYAPYSTVLGGFGNTVNSSTAIACGRNALATNTGQFSQGGQQFAAQGDAQSSVFVIKVQTTDAASTTMTSMGSTPVVPLDTTWAFKCMIAARNTASDAESAAYEVTGCVSRAAGGTMRIVGTPTVTTVAEDVAAWNVAVAVGGSTLQFNVTGEAGKTIRWVGRLELAEVTG
jgi:hypothetical protein